MGVLCCREIGTYLYRETEGAEIRPCRQYQLGIESKPLIDLYLEAEKLAKARKKKGIIYVDLRDAYPNSGFSAFYNEKGEYIVIGVDPTKATEWAIAHEFVHVLVEYDFYCRIKIDNPEHREKYDFMYNIILDIPVNRMVKNRGFDINEEIKWRIERSITPRLEREIPYDSWDRFTHYIVNFFDLELFSGDISVDADLSKTYAKYEKRYRQKFKRDVNLAKHVSRIIRRIGFTSLEEFDRCLIAIFQDERFRGKYDIPKVEIEDDFPEEYKRSGGAAGF